MWLNTAVEIKAGKTNVGNVRKYKRFSFFITVLKIPTFIPLFFCSFALNTSRRGTNRKKCGDRGATVFMAHLDITKRAMNSWRLSYKYCP